MQATLGQLRSVDQRLVVAGTGRVDAEVSDLAGLDLEARQHFHAGLAQPFQTGTTAGVVVGTGVGQLQMGAVVEENAFEGFEKSDQVCRACLEDLIDGLLEDGLAERGGLGRPALVEGLSRDAEGAGEMLERSMGTFEPAEDECLEELGTGEGPFPFDEGGEASQFIGTGAEEGRASRRPKSR